MKNFVYIIIGVFIFLGLNSFFIVNQRQQALVFQFGEVVNQAKEPGLWFKIPLVQTVVYYDKRILNLTNHDKEVIAKDQKRLIVSAFSKFKITNPLTFYQTVRNEDGAKRRLKSILDSSMGEVLGKETISALLTDKRVSIMENIKDIVSTKASRFGIEVLDVRIIRADLPKENSEAIYKRMRTDREKEAKEFRAEGAEEAQRIRAKAEKKKKIILAEARKSSLTTKGEGDGISAKIYAKAYSQDPGFFDFYRSMTAYKKTFSKNDTKMVLSPDTEFMKFFDNNN